MALDKHLEYYKISNEDVIYIFSKFPKSAQEKFLFLRNIIFNLSNKNSQIGKIEETIRWGEVSYVTSQSKSGSTVRINWLKKQPDKMAVYFNCKTSLVASFKEKFGDKFEYNGNRAIILDIQKEIPQELEECIYMSLTYNIKNK